MATDEALETLKYCSVEELESEMDRQLGADDTTVAKRKIKAAEEWIDNHTRNAWRKRKRTEDKEFTLNRQGFAGIPLYLDRMNVRNVTKLEINTGRKTVDYVANRKQGRDEDWWVDKDEGIIYIRAIRFKRPEFAKITYEYGETTVHPDIKEACILLAKNFMANTEGGSFQMPEGGDGVSLSDRANNAKQQAKEFLETHVKVGGMID